MTTPRNPAVTAAFIMEGMLEQNLLHALDAWGKDKGALSLVEAVMQYVPTIHSMLDNVEFIRDDLDGVAEYDVANPFGEWMMQTLIDRGALPDRDEVTVRLARLCGQYATTKRPQQAIPRYADPYTLIDQAVKAGRMPGDPWEVITANQQARLTSTR